MDLNQNVHLGHFQTERILDLLQSVPHALLAFIAVEVKVLSVVHVPLDSIVRHPLIYPLPILALREPIQMKLTCLMFHR